MGGKRRWRNNKKGGPSSTATTTTISSTATTTSADLATTATDVTTRTSGIKEPQGGSTGRETSADIQASPGVDTRADLQQYQGGRYECGVTRNEEWKEKREERSSGREDKEEQRRERNDNGGESKGREREEKEGGRQQKEGDEVGKGGARGDIGGREGIERKENAEEKRENNGNKDGREGEQKVVEEEGAKALRRSRRRRRKKTNENKKEAEEDGKRDEREREMKEKEEREREIKRREREEEEESRRMSLEEKLYEAKKEEDDSEKRGEEEDWERKKLVEELREATEEVDDKEEKRREEREKSEERKRGGIKEEVDYTRGIMGERENEGDTREEGEKEERKWEDMKKKHGGTEEKDNIGGSKEPKEEGRWEEIGEYGRGTEEDEYDKERVEARREEEHKKMANEGTGVSSSSDSDSDLVFLQTANTLADNSNVTSPDKLTDTETNTSNNTMADTGTDNRLDMADSLTGSFADPMIDMPDSLTDTIADTPDIPESYADYRADMPHILTDTMNDILGESRTDNVVDDLTCAMADTPHDSSSDDMADSRHDTMAASVSDTMADSWNDSGTEFLVDSHVDRLTNVFSDSISNTKNYVRSEVIPDPKTESFTDTKAESRAENLADELEGTGIITRNYVPADHTTDSADSQIEHLADITSFKSESVNYARSIIMADSLNNTIADNEAYSKIESPADNMGDMIDTEVNIIPDTMADNNSDGITDTESNAAYSCTDNASYTTADSRCDAKFASISDIISETAADSMAENKANTMPDNLHESMTDSMADLKADTNCSMTDSMADLEADTYSSMPNSMTDLRGDTNSSMPNQRNTTPHSMADNFADSWSDTVPDAFCDAMTDSMAGTNADTIYEANPDTIADNIPTCDTTADAKSDTWDYASADYISDITADLRAEDQTDTSSDRIYDPKSDNAADQRTNSNTYNALADSLAISEWPPLPPPSSSLTSATDSTDSIVSSSPNGRPTTSSLCHHKGKDLPVFFPTLSTENEQTDRTFSPNEEEKDKLEEEEKEDEELGKKRPNIADEELSDNRKENTEAREIDGTMESNAEKSTVREREKREVEEIDEEDKTKKELKKRKIEEMEKEERTTEREEIGSGKGGESEKEETEETEKMNAEKEQDERKMEQNQIDERKVEVAERDEEANVEKEELGERHMGHKHMEIEEVEVIKMESNSDDEGDIATDEELPKDESDAASMFFSLYPEYRPDEDEIEVAGQVAAEGKLAFRCFRNSGETNYEHSSPIPSALAQDQIGSGSWISSEQRQTVHVKSKETWAGKQPRGGEQDETGSHKRETEVPKFEASITSQGSSFSEPEAYDPTEQLSTPPAAHVDEKEQCPSVPDHMVPSRGPINTLGTTLVGRACQWLQGVAGWPSLTSDTSNLGNTKQDSNTNDAYNNRVQNSNATDNSNSGNSEVQDSNTNYFYTGQMETEGSEEEYVDASSSQKVEASQSFLSNNQPDKTAGKMSYIPVNSLNITALLTSTNENKMEEEGKSNWTSSSTPLECVQEQHKEHKEDDSTKEEINQGRSRKVSDSDKRNVGRDRKDRNSDDKNIGNIRRDSKEGDNHNEEKKARRGGRRRRYRRRTISRGEDQDAGRERKNVCEGRGEEKKPKYSNEQLESGAGKYVVSKSGGSKDRDNEHAETNEQVKTNIKDGKRDWEAEIERAENDMDTDKEKDKQGSKTYEEQRHMERERENDESKKTDTEHGIYTYSEKFDAAKEEIHEMKKSNSENKPGERKKYNADIGEVTFQGHISNKPKKEEEGDGKSRANREAESKANQEQQQNWKEGKQLQYKGLYREEIIETEEYIDILIRFPYKYTEPSPAHFNRWTCPQGFKVYNEIKWTQTLRDGTKGGLKSNAGTENMNVDLIRSDNKELVGFEPRFSDAPMKLQYPEALSQPLSPPLTPSYEVKWISDDSESEVKCDVIKKESGEESKKMGNRLLKRRIGEKHKAKSKLEQNIYPRSERTPSPVVFSFSAADQLMNMSTCVGEGITFGDDENLQKVGNEENHYDQLREDLEGVTDDAKLASSSKSSRFTFPAPLLTPAHPLSPLRILTYPEGSTEPLSPDRKLLSWPARLPKTENKDHYARTEISNGGINSFRQSQDELDPECENNLLEGERIRQKEGSAPEGFMQASEDLKWAPDKSDYLPKSPTTFTQPLPPMQNLVYPGREPPSPDPRELSWPACLQSKQIKKDHGMLQDTTYKPPQEIPYSQDSSSEYNRELELNQEEIGTNLEVCDPNLQNESYKVMKQDLGLNWASESEQYDWDSHEWLPESLAKVCDSMVRVCENLDSMPTISLTTRSFPPPLLTTARPLSPLLSLVYPKSSSKPHSPDPRDLAWPACIQHKRDTQDSSTLNCNILPCSKYIVQDSLTSEFPVQQISQEVEEKYVTNEPHSKLETDSKTKVTGESDQFLENETNITSNEIPCLPSPSIPFPPPLLTPGRPLSPLLTLTYPENFIEPPPTNPRDLAWPACLVHKLDVKYPDGAGPSMAIPIQAGYPQDNELSPNISRSQSEQEFHKKIETKDALIEFRYELEAEGKIPIADETDRATTNRYTSEGSETESYRPSFPPPLLTEARPLSPLLTLIYPENVSEPPSPDQRDLAWPARVQPQSKSLDHDTLASPMLDSGTTSPTQDTLMCLQVHKYYLKGDTTYQFDQKESEDVSGIKRSSDDDQQTLCNSSQIGESYEQQYITDQESTGLLTSKPFPPPLLYPARPLSPFKTLIYPGTENPPSPNPRKLAWPACRSSSELGGSKTTPMTTNSEEMFSLQEPRKNINTIAPEDTKSVITISTEDNSNKVKTQGKGKPEGFASILLQPEAESITGPIKLVAPETQVSSRKLETISEQQPMSRTTNDKDEDPCSADFTDTVKSESEENEDEEQSMGIDSNIEMDKKRSQEKDKTTGLLKRDNLSHRSSPTLQPRPPLSRPTQLPPSPPQPQSPKPSLTPKLSVSKAGKMRECHTSKQFEEQLIDQNQEETEQETNLQESVASSSKTVSECITQCSEAIKIDEKSVSKPDVCHTKADSYENQTDMWEKDSIESQPDLVMIKHTEHNLKTTLNAKDGKEDNEIVIEEDEGRIITHEFETDMDELDDMEKQYPSMEEFKDAEEFISDKIKQKIEKDIKPTIKDFKMTMEEFKPVLEEFKNVIDKKPAAFESKSHIEESKMEFESPFKTFNPEAKEFKPAQEYKSIQDSKPRKDDAKLGKMSVAERIKSVDASTFNRSPESKRKTVTFSPNTKTEAAGIVLTSKISTPMPVPLTFYSKLTSSIPQMASPTKKLDSPDTMTSPVSKMNLSLPVITASVSQITLPPSPITSPDKVISSPSRTTTSQTTDSHDKTDSHTTKSDSNAQQSVSCTTESNSPVKEMELHGQEISSPTSSPIPLHSILVKESKPKLSDAMCSMPAPEPKLQVYEPKATSPPVVCQPLQHHKPALQESKQIYQEYTQTLQESKSIDQESTPGLQEYKPTLQENNSVHQEYKATIQESIPVDQKSKPVPQESTPTTQEYKSSQEHHPAIQESKLSQESKPQSPQFSTKESGPSIEGPISPQAIRSIGNVKLEELKQLPQKPKSPRKKSPSYERTRTPSPKVIQPTQTLKRAPPHKEPQQSLIQELKPLSSDPKSTLKESKSFSPDTKASPQDLNHTLPEPRTTSEQLQSHRSSTSSEGPQSPLSYQCQTSISCPHNSKTYRTTPQASRNGINANEEPRSPSHENSVPISPHPNRKGRRRKKR